MLLKAIHWNIGGAKIRLRTDDPDSDTDKYCHDGLSYVSEQMKVLQPDIVTLVETHADKQRVQARAIAKELGLQYVSNHIYANSHIEEGQGLGAAVISRFPITREEFTLFHNPGFIYKISLRAAGKPAHDKGVLKCFVDIKGNTVEVEATHLFPFRRLGVDPLGRDADDIREDVTQKLLPGTEKVLLQGDFNVNNTSLRAFLPGLFAAGLEEVVLNEPTAPAGRNYDHILYRKLRHIQSKVFAEVLCDHFLVYSEFEL